MRLIPWASRAREDGARAATRDARGSLAQAQAALGAQRDKLAAEHEEVLGPLRRMRLRNHFADLVMDALAGKPGNGG